MSALARPKDIHEVLLEWFEARYARLAQEESHGGVKGTCGDEFRGQVAVG